MAGCAFLRPLDVVRQSIQPRQHHLGMDAVGVVVLVADVLVGHALRALRKLLARRTSTWHDDAVHLATRPVARLFRAIDAQVDVGIRFETAQSNILRVDGPGCTGESSIE